LDGRFDRRVIAQEPSRRVRVGVQLGQLHDVPYAALMCHAREGDLLVLRALGRVSHQERPVHAGARPAHRIDILEVALDELHVREPMRVRFPRIACDRAHLDAVGSQSLDDFAAHRPGRPGNQNHCCFSSRRPPCSSAEMAA
jgi:hypothetical protein